MKIDLIYTPIAATEVMSILEMPREQYDAAVATGALRKDVKGEWREGGPASHHNFYNILYLLLWAKMTNWAGLIDWESLQQILSEVEESRGIDHSHADLTSNLSTLPVEAKIKHQFEPEVVDKIMKIVAEVDLIWISLFNRVMQELESNRECEPHFPTPSKIEGLKEGVFLSLYKLTTKVSQAKLAIAIAH